MPAKAASEPTSTDAADVLGGQQTTTAEGGKGNDLADMPFHEAANVFPLLEGLEYEEFKEDIRVNGQGEDITTYRGTILDGRNRYRACRELGIEPRTREWDARGSVLAFVVSRNLRRRHLSESQRAMVAARMKPLFEQEARERMRAGKAADPMANLPQGPARDQAAAALHVSPRSVDAASKVLQQGAPDLGRAVDEGRVSVSAAAGVTGLPREEQAEIAARGKKEAAARSKQARGQKAEGREGQGAGSRRRDRGEPKAPPRPVEPGPRWTGRVLPRATRGGSVRRFRSSWAR